jgi:phosphoglycerol transferase
MVQALISFLLFSFLIFLAIWDQNVSSSTGSADASRKNLAQSYEEDQKFITLIEKSLPDNSAIYQLPYMGFPEQPNILQMPVYSNLIGFIHSNSLRWNLGAMKGRGGDLFYRALALESIPVQLDVMRRLGFAGVYIDRRGYPDQGHAVELELFKALGYGPDLIKSNNQAVFFRLKDFDSSRNIEGLSSREILSRAGYTIPDQFVKR